jgi:multidrug efflux pump subunit AcrB
LHSKSEEKINPIPFDEKQHFMSSHNNYNSIQKVINFNDTTNLETIMLDVQRLMNKIKNSFQIPKLSNIKTSPKLTLFDIITRNKDNSNNTK